MFFLERAIAMLFSHNLTYEENTLLTRTFIVFQDIRNTVRFFCVVCTVFVSIFRHNRT